MCKSHLNYVSICYNVEILPKRIIKHIRISYNVKILLKWILKTPQKHNTPDWILKLTYIISHSRSNIKYNTRCLRINSLFSQNLLLFPWSRVVFVVGFVDSWPSSCVISSDTIILSRFCRMGFVDSWSSSCVISSG